MALKSSKHREMKQFQMVLNGGLNYAQTPSNIKDNELRRANNFIYDPETDFLITRPGTACKTAAKCDGTNPIIAIYYFEHSSTEAWLVAACNGNLYYLSGAGLNAWTKIGALNDTTTAPSFITFNTLLLIADGGAEIKTWDGTTYTTITGSPAANALSRIKNRIVANHVSEPDSVYLSGPYDATSAETGWDTSGDAIGFKAGYGDLLSVKAFGVFGDDLIIFKTGDALKMVYRLNVANATNTNWYVQEVSANNSAQNSHSVVNAWNNVFFVDDNGFKSILGVDVYGDLQVDQIGRKINTLFTSQTNCDFMTYVPKYNAIWFGMGDRIFCYTERGTFDEKGNASVTPAFTDILFKQGRIRSVCQAGDVVYLAGNDGFLYYLSESISTDATDATTSVNYSSTARTKTLNFSGEGILKKLQISLSPQEAGAASLMVYTNESTGQSVKTITLTSDGTDLADATTYLAAGTGYLYDEGSSPWVETTRNRIRSDEMAFEVLVSSGRVGVEWIKGEIAMVEG